MSQRNRINGQSEKSVRGVKLGILYLASIRLLEFVSFSFGYFILDGVGVGRGRLFIILLIKCANYDSHFNLFDLGGVSIVLSLFPFPFPVFHLPPSPRLPRSFHFRPLLRGCRETLYDVFTPAYIYTHTYIILVKNISAKGENRKEKAFSIKTLILQPCIGIPIRV